jgi:hypothetical protein
MTDLSRNGEIHRPHFRHANVMKTDAVLQARFETAVASTSADYVECWLQRWVSPPAFRSGEKRSQIDDESAAGVTVIRRGSLDRKPNRGAISGMARKALARRGKVSAD